MHSASSTSLRTCQRSGHEDRHLPSNRSGGVSALKADLAVHWPRHFEAPCVGNHQFDEGKLSIPVPLDIVNTNRSRFNLSSATPLTVNGLMRPLAVNGSVNGPLTVRWLPLGTWVPGDTLGTHGPPGRVPATGTGRPGHGPGMASALGRTYHTPPPVRNRPAAGCHSGQP